MEEKFIGSTHLQLGKHVFINEKEEHVPDPVTRPTSDPFYVDI